MFAESGAFEFASVLAFAQSGFHDFAQVGAKEEGVDFALHFLGRGAFGAGFFPFEVQGFDLQLVAPYVLERAVFVFGDEAVFAVGF